MITYMTLFVYNFEEDNVIIPGIVVGFMLQYSYSRSNLKIVALNNINGAKKIKIY